MNILISVTHLLGVGHFARMRILAKGLVQKGHQVTLISGGRPQSHLDCAGINLVQLPPVHCVGSDFRTLYEADGFVLTDNTRIKRRELLVATLLSTRPDVVITETFPFGRRALKDEFLALCMAASELRPRPALVASIRDVLNPPSSAAKADEAEQWISRFYDAVLVHGDAGFVSPERGWPFGRNGQRALRMTGFIDEMAQADVAAEMHGRIIVSGGGSAASMPLYRAALNAAARMPALHWQMLIGHGVPQKDYESLLTDAPANMLVERARPDFRVLLRGAALSVSQAGYNTIVDLCAASTRMVLVPFSAGQEREQTLRAEALAARGLAHLVPEHLVDGASLAKAVAQALAFPPPQPGAFSNDGVIGSIVALENAVADRQAIENAWLGLENLLHTLHRDGKCVDMWWRDDDAVEMTPQLQTLLSLSQRLDAPVALAVIPKKVDPALAQELRGFDCDVLLHGIAHQNHAPTGAKKQELGYHAIGTLMRDLRDARTTMQQLFPNQMVPVLVPPWNRIDPHLIPHLPEAGYIGLSTFKTRKQARPARGLLQINTHCDPIAWKDGGGLLPEYGILTHLTDLIAAQARQERCEREPIGLLTHHLVHDPRLWGFLERLFAALAGSGAVNFKRARQIFDVHQTV